MRFDVPGMTKDNVMVWVEEKMLVVKAQKVLKHKSENEKEGGVEEEEWPAKSYGKYSTTEVKYGVLYITIPKGKIVILKKISFQMCYIQTNNMLR